MSSLLSPKSLVRSRMAHKLRLEMFVLVVDAGQGLAVEHAVVAAVVDAGTALHTLK